MKIPLLDLIAQHQTIREEVMAIITTSYTFFATTSAITRLGAKPVYLDINRDDFNINVDRLEQSITSMTKAILPVPLRPVRPHGCHLAVADKHGIPVVEDAAQAIGAEFDGRRAGTIGAIGCFSFFPSKNLGGAGDSGLMTTNDDQLAARLRILRVHGMEPKYYHQVVGINSRLDALQAAVLRVKLKYLDQWNEARCVNAGRYDRLFKQAGISQVTTPVAHSNCRHIYHQYTIRCTRRDELKAHLQQAGIGSEVYYPVPLHLQQCFEFLGIEQGALPETELAALECLSLPIYPELTEEMQQFVVEKIAGFTLAENYLFPVSAASTN
ncbi:MAG: DegT/DnrJ/EryC1/StrS family aminotransferase [Acidobacteria bacterium]|nr:DegT/DnrJ/EryC1/StrS family aminotransferase [Acidobacteriota bacterium]